MADFLNRRGILRGLASLPLLGGGVTLIGQPTASAEPLTLPLLDNYHTWLHYEAKLLGAEMALRFADDRYRYGVNNENAAGKFHGDDYMYWKEGAPASNRAAIVLSAIGCDWRQS